jgi:hypothetical protein
MRCVQMAIILSAEAKKSISQPAAASGQPRYFSVKDADLVEIETAD